MSRRRHSAKDRARIFAANGGICHLCGGSIQTGEAWEVEHVIALELSGDDTDANKRPAHVKCHRAKTADDMGKIAKAKRNEARHTGAARPKQTIKSAGFPKREAREPKPGLPPRQMYRNAE
jgi:5-methylcytosine-specific restriction enzyme A